MRSERRQAALAVIEALLRHLDPVSLRIGARLSKSDFLPLDMKSIAAEAGMNRRRCTRAIALLKQMGFVEVHQPQYGNNPTKYAGLRAVRAITPALLDWLQAVRQSEIQPGKSDSLLHGVNHESD